MADWVETGHESSWIEYVDEAQISRSRSGAVRVRRLQSKPFRIFHYTLRGLTAARRDAVMALFNSKRSTTLTVTWYPLSIGSPGETNIVCVFGPNPISWRQNGDRWDADVDLYEAT